MSKLPAIAVATLALALVAAAMPAGAKRAACPTVGILADAERLTQMQNGRIDLKAEIREPELTCAVAGKTAKSKLSFWVKSAISPMSDVAPRTVPYFVAVIADGEVVEKQVFEMTLPFADGNRKLTIKENVARIDIPVAKGKSPDDYSVTIGFQLTPEQADYNRAPGR